MGYLGYIRSRDTAARLIHIEDRWATSRGYYGVTRCRTGIADPVTVAGPIMAGYRPCPKCMPHRRGSHYLTSEEMALMAWFRAYGDIFGLSDETRALIVKATPPPEATLDVIERVNDLPDATLTVEGVPDTDG